MKMTPLFFGIIACIMEKTLNGLIMALHKAQQANSLEIRLDLLYASNSSEKLLEILAMLPKLIGDKLTILTLGSTERGGRTRISLEDQLKFWQGLPAELAELIQSKDSKVFVDLDLTFIHYVVRKKAKLPFPWEKIGASLHIMDRTPNRQTMLVNLHRLQKVLARAFLKYVTFARKDEDASRIWPLFHKRYGDKRPLIAFAMGACGRNSRFECMIHGSAGTYCFVNTEEVAPGQVSLETLRNDPRMRLPWAQS